MANLKLPTGQFLLSVPMEGLRLNNLLIPNGQRIATRLREAYPYSFGDSKILLGQAKELYDLSGLSEEECLEEARRLVKGYSVYGAILGRVDEDRRVVTFSWAPDLSVSMCSSVGVFLYRAGWPRDVLAHTSLLVFTLKCAYPS